MSSFFCHYYYICQKRKEKIMQCVSHSFAAKLNLYILFPMLILGGVSFIIFQQYAARDIERSTYNRLNESAKKTNLKVTRLLRTIEKIPENLSWILPSYVTTPDSIFSITRQVVKNNTEIFGCAIAFEPYYFPCKGQFFAPYSYMKGDSVITTQIDKKYDYYQKNWYRISKERNSSRWSRPYHELSAHEIITTTYSVPLHNAQKKIIGIFSVDLSMNWLTSMIDSIKPYEDSYSIIINKEGKYILHPQKKMIVEKDSPKVNIISEMSDPSATGIIRNMLKGETGNGIFKDEGIHYYIYYTPIEGTEWVMATIFPYSHIFGGLNRFNKILILLFLLFMGIIIFTSTVSIRKITLPLKKFASSAHAIANGNFSTPLPTITSHDEMQEMYIAFSEMQIKLKQYMYHLEKTTAAKEKIESELRIAHDIQMSMLPKIFPPFPERKEIDLYAVLYPARQVGGDLYDYFIRDNYFYFAIGDVSGKGIPASLLMASTISLMRSYSSDYFSPAQIARFVNNGIAERNETDMFVTLFFGKLNLLDGTLCYCNAGHTPPILTSPDQTISFLNIQPDIPLGIIKNHNYQEFTYQFSSGSGLLLYTDGVTDAENAKGDFYTKERLLNTVRNSNKLHPREFIEAILADIHSHTNSRLINDDLSMLTFIYGHEWNINNS